MAKSIIKQMKDMMNTRGGGKRMTLSQMGLTKTGKKKPKTRKK